MKFFLIGLLIPILVLADVVPNCQELLDEVNIARAKYSKDHNIANMNELYYDFRLEKIVIEHLEKNDGCLEKDLISLEDNLQMSNMNAKTYSPQLLLAPGSTKICGVRSRCKGDLITILILDNDPNNLVIYGPPGSKCAVEKKPVSSNG